MTETITIRLRRPKADVKRHAKPNLNAYINNLIDADMAKPRKADWDAHYARLKTRKPCFYRADEVRAANRR